MNNKYLLSYLREFYKEPRMNQVLDYFKVDFDYYLYAYGSHFSGNNNKEMTLQHMYNNAVPFVKFKKKNPYHGRIYSWLRHKAYLFVSRKLNKSVEMNSNVEGSNKIVLFLDNISIKTRAKFAEKRIKVVCLEEITNNKTSELNKIFEWYDSLSQLSFRERLELNRYECLDDFIKLIQKNFSTFDGLFVGNDEYFICKLFIDAFKGMGIPTFNWCHGLDCALGVPKRVDYQLVWGKGVRDNLVKAGGNPNSIIVSGNINYIDIPNHSQFRNSLADVLVLTTATIANIRHTWDYESFSIWDRSLLITYIYSVENVLKSLGVKRARLRPHPINNKFWVDKFIDTDFYIMDDMPLNKSLNKATLAIGPTSSTFVEAMREGVTYLVYEPGKEGKNLQDGMLRPPFDGSDENLKVAFSEDQLREMIITHYSCNQKILEKYIVPFDIDSFKHKLGKKDDVYE